MGQESFPDDHEIAGIIFDADMKRRELEFLYNPAPGLLEALDARRALAFAMGQKPIEAALAPTLLHNNNTIVLAFELVASSDFNEFAEDAKNTPRNTWYGGSSLDLDNLNGLKEKYHNNAGMLSNEAFKLMVGLYSTKYHDALGSSDLMVKNLIVLPPQEEAKQGSMLIKDFVHSLEAEGQIEYSEASFHDDHRHLTKVMQAELVRGAMEYLLLFSQTMHWRVDVANSLLAKHRTACVTDNLSDKIAMTKEIIEVFQGVKVPKKDPYKARIMHFILRAAAESLITVENLLQKFGDVYQAKGIEMPDELRAVRESIDSMFKEEANDSAEGQGQDVALLHQEFNMRVEQWKVPAPNDSAERKALKRAFTPFRRALVAAGNLRSKYLLAGVRNEEEATVIVDLFTYFEAKTQEASQAAQMREELASLLDMREQIIAEEEQAHQNNDGRTANSPKSFSFGLLGVLQDPAVWQKMRPIVVAHWPGNGSQIASLVDRLFGHQ